MVKRTSKSSTSDKRSENVEHFPDHTPATSEEAAVNTMVEALALGSGVSTVIVEAALGAVNDDDDKTTSASPSKSTPRDSADKAAGEGRKR